MKNFSSISSDYVKHEYIKTNSILKKQYQTSAATQSLDKNLLVVLPTGTGKTVIMLLLIADLLSLDENRKILIMAPTRPLIKQHFDFIQHHLLYESKKLIWLTGKTISSNRKYKWMNANIFFATPQVVRNDLLSGILSLEDFDLVVFDEAHRAVKDYAYTKIAYLIRNYKTIRRLALTASPGNKQRIKEISENLGLDSSIIKTRESRDIQVHLQELSSELIEIQKDAVLDHSLNLLQQEAENLIQKIKTSMGYVHLNPKMLSYVKLNIIKNQVEKKFWKGEISSNQIWMLRKSLSALTKLDRLMEYLECYSYNSFLNFIDRMKLRSNKSRNNVDKSILKTSSLQESKLLIENSLTTGMNHPKIEKLIAILVKEISNGSRALVFVGLRDVALEIRDMLIDQGLSPGILIGQSKKSGSGMDQNEQIEAISSFSSGNLNPLIATQVGEEGLDISECNLVIFYDQPVSAIRRIQRTGRTGRTKPGKAIFLIIKGGRDEIKYWAGLKKEKSLHKIGNTKHVSASSLTDFME